MTLELQTPAHSERASIPQPVAEEPVLERARTLLGGGLLVRVGLPGRLPAWPGRLLRRKGSIQPGPDGTVVVHGGWVPRNAGGWTHGNWIIVRKSTPISRALLNHEYVHVLQYREQGALRFYRRYLRDLLRAWREKRSIWEVSPSERVALAVEALYRLHPELPDLWELRQREA